MKLLFLLVLLMQSGANSPGGPDRVVPARRGKLDELSVGQMMRLATMAPARLEEARCGGLAKWQVANHRPDALRASVATRLVDKVAKAVANDSAIPTPHARAFVEEFASEVEYQRGQRDTRGWSAWLGQQTTQCAALFAAARSGSFELHPLANASVVDPALASCYGQYRAAAERASGEEKAGLLREADRAEALALDGKAGPDRAAAKAFLAAEAASAASAPKGEEEADMMRLVVCLPLMQPSADAGAR